MKNVSFGKERDCPVTKRKDDELNDEIDLDSDDNNESSENDKKNNKRKENKKQSKEVEINTNNHKNKKLSSSSESENDDSDKSSSDENEKSKKNNNGGKEEKRGNEENKKEDQVLKNKKDKNKDDKELEKDDGEEDKDINKVNERKSKQKEIEDILIESIKNKENATSQKIHMAEEIDFKSIPDKLITTDQYGFLKNNNDNKNEESKNKSEDLLQINARLEKWGFMIENYKEFSKKNYSKLKSRTRKGIPDSLRSYVWQIFAEKEKYEEKNIFNKLDSIPINEETEIVIIKDLDRTFPACQFFKEKYGNGQRKLYKVLSSYSKYNTSTGYVQGMGFIVAVFLTYMDEESSFFMLHSLMKKYGLEGFYQPNFPKLKGTFYVLLNLLKKFVPKVYNLFKKEGMIPSMYGSEWFICLFSRNLPFNSLVRIFDVFLLEGYKVIYRFALAFLKLKEDKFLEGKDGLASIMQTLNECYENVDIEKLFKIAFGFSISRQYIEKLEKEYESVKDDQKNEFVQQL